MDLDETMVEEQDNMEADDALPEDVVEEQDESEESLESFSEGEGQPAEPETPSEEPPSASEPGWIKKRVEKAVSKAVAQTRAEMQAMFDQQMAPIREKMLNDEARELVRSGEFKSLERAKEYLQLKQGLPVSANKAPAPQAQPRQANGQFAPKEDPAITARIEMLKHQADKIRGAKGPDVIAEFQNNPEIQEKVKAGEMDFYDVADYLKDQKSSRKKPPAPMRSPNGASGSNNPNAIDSMSDEQFDRMEKRIAGGARIRLS